MADIQPLSQFEVTDPLSLEEGDDSTLEALAQPRRARLLYKAGLAAAGLLGVGLLGAAAVASRAASPKVSVGLTATQLQETVLTDGAAPAAAGATDESACSMAKKGDTCFDNVVWSMTEGISKNATWYMGLTKKSLFEEFQAHVHATEPEKCPMPCIKKGCQTAEPGTECYTSATWAMTMGIKKHPSWYKGLTEDSPFEGFQTNVHHFNASLCPIPCNPQPFNIVSLFCWAVVRSAGPELDLVKAQLQEKAGIFACDGYALVSDKAVNLGQGPLGLVTTISIGSTQVSGYTGDGTSPNAPVFVNAWNAVQPVADKLGYDFMVKVDPDTVLIPEVLKTQLANPPKNPYPPPYTPPASHGVMVTNCDKMASWGAGWGAGWPMMYGSLEIISREAMNMYYARLDECKGSMPWMGMGEDAFMGLCLRHLQVGELFIKNGDNLCGGAACTDKTKAAFHPKKSVGEWLQCLKENRGR